jgi:hypothetical protein
VVGARRHPGRGLSEGVAEAHGHFAPKLAVHDRWYLLNRIDEKKVRRVKQSCSMA